MNQINLNGLSLSDTIAVTAYDGDIDGTDDQTEGNESWFRYARSPSTIYVSTGGSDDNQGTINNEYATIQTAINTAINGDTIHVAEGTYFENLIINKHIFLKGQNSNNTVIDGGSAGSVIVLNQSIIDQVKIESFRIQNGSGSAGMYSDSYITNQQLMGGGIVSISNDIILNDMVFQNNSAEYGGGIFSHNSNMNISNVEFKNNEATNGQGGAIWSYVDDGLSKTISIDSATVSQNTSTHRGAGLTFVRGIIELKNTQVTNCLLYTSPSPRDLSTSRMPSSA